MYIVEYYFTLSAFQIIIVPTAKKRRTILAQYLSVSRKFSLPIYFDVVDSDSSDSQASILILLASAIW